MRRGIIRKGIISILVIILFLLVYITSMKIHGLNERLHTLEFQKYNVYDKFPDQDVGEIHGNILSYVAGDSDDYSKDILNNREIRHLEDVRNTIKIMDILYYSLLIIFLVFLILLYRVDRSRFFYTLIDLFLYTGMIILLMSLIVSYLAITDFDGFFTLFHRALFEEGTWVFSPDDTLIKLYPSAFFYDITRFIFMSSLGYGIAFTLPGIFIGAKSFIAKYLKKKKPNNVK
ncbi:MAG: TIGR01906 family membrane protein [Nanoarchaeota archaeon]|nr:TIGR01906 family membrane protein [Nanoarchaeota archaeon]